LFALRPHGTIADQPQPKDKNMTTRRSLALPFVLFAVFATSGLAQSRPATSGNTDSPLAPVAWLVGGTWVSDVKDPSDGSVTHVENRIRWAPNHQGIEFTTDFDGKPYNPVAKTIGFYYTNSGGELTIGTATPDPDGKTLRQDFDIMHTNGKTGHIRSTLERDGDNAYWFTVFMQKDGDWAQVFKIRYERK
jgi:hypothetical protein